MIQADDELADHVHVVPVETAIDAVPPSKPKLLADGASWKEHDGEGCGVG